ncbi:MAG TPA: hypothetical protein VEY95_14630 [Azospirillaceae bacterium]|nr:hypothetical protein [Azospirillaceae bacterium]
MDEAQVPLLERLQLKLLASAAQSTGAALREALCTEPDRDLVRRLAAEAQSLLAEFLEDYGGTS